MADTPARIQRLRTKGWRMPVGAVYVGRPSKWGNPWKAELVEGVGWCCTDTRTDMCAEARGPADAHDVATYRFRHWLQQQPELTEAVRTELRGKVLCCWCPPHLACHADVLREIANG